MCYLCDTVSTVTLLHWIGNYHVLLEGVEASGLYFLGKRLASRVIRC